jgi:dUTP pyrophosphatase
VSTVRVEVKRLPNGEGLELPGYATSGSAAVDLVAAVAEPLTLVPGARAAVPTGIAIALPDGFEGQVRPRSGLAIEHGVTVLNTPGTIDADYRGEVQVILINLGEAPVVIERGMRIAQMVISRVERAQLRETPALPATGRGSGGFGSTGGHR